MDMSDETASQSETDKKKTARSKLQKPLSKIKPLKNTSDLEKGVGGGNRSGEACVNTELCTADSPTPRRC